MNALKSLCLPVLFSVLSATAFAADGDPSQPDPQTPSLTTTVTNSNGDSLIADTFYRTLYVFDSDQGSDTPTCTGDCSEIWPPYILSATEATGLQSPLGSVTRASGNVQLTYNGRPVYTYGFDRQEGADMGDGVGNLWHHIIDESGD